MGVTAATGNSLAVVAGMTVFGIGVVVAMLGYSAGFAVAAVLVIAVLPVAFKARD
jgi:hypothetical protein